MREWWTKLQTAIAGRRAATSDDLDAEINAHLQLEIDEHIADGLMPEQAAAAARKHFGNIMATREKAREAWAFPRFETFVQDIRYGLRGMRRSKVFSFIVILTFALGIGATTAIFSVVYAALLKPLPYPASERLVRLEESTPSAEGISVTWLNFLSWRKLNHSFEEMAAYEMAHFTLTGRGGAELTRAGLVTSGFFPLLGQRPLMGRLIQREDEELAAPATVVVTHAFWVNNMSADPRALGSTLALDGRPYQIIGVLAADPAFFAKPVDFYIPLALSQRNTIKRSQHGSVRVLARLKPHITSEAALADLNGIMKSLAETDPGPENDHRARGESLTDSDTQGIRPTLWLLAGAVALVLLVACANVASLLLARGAARGGEIAIRTAIGSGTSRLIRQLLTEGVLLAGLGGLGGLLLAYAGLRGLIAVAPQQIPRIAETGLDWQVLAFAAGITLVTGLLVGCAPIIVTGKLDIAGALRDDSRSVTGTRRGQSFRSLLVIAEIAITLVLCFSSGLLLRSLIAAQRGNPGLAPDHVLALELLLPSSSYGNPEKIATFYAELEQELHTLPSVTDVGAVNCPPSAGDCSDWFYSVLGKPQPARSDVPIALFNVADADYFRSVRIPIRQGRTFTPNDRSTGPRVAFMDNDRATGPRIAVVNEQFARKWWPGESAVGKQIKVGGPYLAGPVYEIVGVVGNVSQMGMDQEPLPEIYQPASQSPSPALVVMIRCSGDMGQLAIGIRRRVAALDRNLPIQSLRPLEQTMAATLERRRFSTLLLSLFGLLAVVLSGVGIYGLLTYWVRVREGDIAIRIALGAERTTIVSCVGIQAMRLAAAGLTIGLFGAWIASRWLQSMLFGISAHNSATLAGAVFAVLALTLLAAVIPVWRATRIDPLGRLHAA